MSSGNWDAKDSSAWKLNKKIWTQAIKWRKYKFMKKYWKLDTIVNFKVREVNEIKYLTSYFVRLG